MLAPPDKRGALWAELKRELELHEQIEDARLYEPLSHDVGSKDSKVTAWQQQQAEVHTIEGLIRSVDGRLADDARGGVPLDVENGEAFFRQRSITDRSRRPRGTAARGAITVWPHPLTLR